MMCRSKARYRARKTRGVRSSRGAAPGSAGLGAVIGGWFSCRVGSGGQLRKAGCEGRAGGTRHSSFGTKILVTGPVVGRGPVTGPRPAPGRSRAGIGGADGGQDGADDRGGAGGRGAAAGGPGAVDPR